MQTSDALRDMESRLLAAAEELGVNEHRVHELQGELERLDAAKELEVSKLLQLTAEQELLTSAELAKRDDVVREAAEMDARLEAARSATAGIEADAAAHRELQENIRQLEVEEETIQHRVEELKRGAKENSALELQRRQAVLDALKLLEHELVDARLELDSSRAAVSTQVVDLESLKRCVSSS